MAATATKTRTSRPSLSVVGKQRPDQVEMNAVMAPMLAETKQRETERAAEQHPAQCRAVTEPDHRRAMCRGEHVTKDTFVVATGGGFSPDEDGALYPMVQLYGQWSSDGRECVSIELVSREHSAELTPDECDKLAAELIGAAQTVRQNQMRSVEQWNTAPQ